MLLAILSFIGCTVRNMIVENIIEDIQQKPKSYLINKNEIIKLDYVEIKV